MGQNENQQMTKNKSQLWWAKMVINLNNTINAKQKKQAKLRTKICVLQAEISF